METLDHTPSEPKNADYKVLAIQYGLLSGAVSFVLMLGAYLIGFDLQMPNTETIPKYIISAIGIIIYVVLLSTAMKKHRDENQGGYLSLRNAIGIGMWLSIGSSAVTIVYSLLMKYFINPNYLEEMKAASYQVWEKEGLAEDQMDQYWDFTQIFLGEPVGSILAIIFGLIGGLIMGAIVGYFVKKTNK